MTLTVTFNFYIRKTTGEQALQSAHALTTTTTNVQLPNFFMKPQEMAESMRTLRIAANFRNSPRGSRNSNNHSRQNSTPTSARMSSTASPDLVTASLSSTCDVGFVLPSNGTTTAAGTSRTAARYEQLRQDRQVPVESSEMARIASIFASTNQK